jgi:branched-chain amino acid aminotransferase
MTVHIRVLVEGKIRSVEYFAETLDLAARFEPDGIYDVTKIHKGRRVLLLDSHFDRLEYSAQLEGFHVKIDRQAVREAIRIMLDESGLDQARLRLAIGRKRPKEIYIALEPFNQWAMELRGLRTKGIKVVTYRIERPNPVAKTNAWVHTRQAVRQKLGEGFYEVVIVNEQKELLEGFTSNFYAILDRKLYTAPAGVLPGIMRDIILQVAAEILPVKLGAVRINEIPQVSEAFLTSTSRGILPIVQIDQVRIGDGVPGRCTKTLLKHFNAWIEEHLDKI